MKPFPMQELVKLIAQIKGGNAKIYKQLEKHIPLLGQLWRLVVKAKGKCDAAFKKRAFVKLFDEQTAYDEAKMDELLEDLHEYVDMFYRANIQTNTAMGQKTMADNLRKHGFNKSANKAIRKTLRLAEKEPETTQHFVNLSIHNERYLQDKENNAASREICIQEKNKLDLVFDLEDSIDELSKLRRLRKKTGKELLQKIVRIQASIPSEKTPLIAIQLKAVEYFLNPSLMPYQAFKSVFFEKVDLLKSKQSDLLYFLIKALMVFPNAPKEVRQDYVLLYEFGIDRGLFLKQGKVEPLMFDNIVYAAHSIGDYRLLNKAIEAYEGKVLGEDDKDRSLAMAKAYLHYGNGEYAKALEVLTALDKDNYLPDYLVLKKYILGFKCAYQHFEDRQDAVIYMDYKEGSFKGILRTYHKIKEKINAIDRQNYLNFFEILYKIADRNTAENTRKNLEKLLDSYEGKILESKWLMNKIAELD